MPPGSRDRTRSGYDAISREYAARFVEELRSKPFDCERLDDFSKRLSGLGPVLDLGCGPGQIGAYLAERGVDVRGLDLSPGMIEIARELHASLDFQVGDMRDLPFADASLAGISAFYCLIHIPRDEVTEVLRELYRVLHPGGLLLATVHLGSDVQHVDELFGETVSLDFVFFERAEMERYLHEAGFEIMEAHEREPYADVEAPTRRAYLLARRPDEPHDAPFDRSPP